MSNGRAQAARELARLRPEATVHCWYLDSHHASLAKEFNEGLPANMTIDCRIDWPEQECDLAIMPLSMSGESELTRDLLQSAYMRLAIGGILIVSVDNPKDTWVHDQLKQYNKSIKVRPFDDAVVYFLYKEQPLKKQRNYECDLVFRDLDRLLQLVTRPGVFSHRELDTGARHLLDSVDVFPDSRLLEIGCGSGAVSIGLAARDPKARVHAVDSNARAVWCTAEGARRNGLENLTVELNHTGVYGEPKQYDMALANPPYYGDFHIAELFIEAAIRSLRPGGRLVLVTKQAKWYDENLSRWLQDHEVYPCKKYFIASGTKPNVNK